MTVKKILVVDDDAEILRALAKVLIKENYEVKTAASPQEALAHLERSERFDLVITDLSMPGQNGIALLRKLKACAPSARALGPDRVRRWGQLRRRDGARSRRVFVETERCATTFGGDPQGVGRINHDNLSSVSPLATNRQSKL
jgi:hypothetical protein